MKAMIFAAGMGTRLRPLTDNTPKALVPVAGKPILERVILRLKACGFTEITVNIHHLGGQIIDFLHDRDNFGVTIHISDERGALLDTGGGIRKARPFLEGEEPFLVHNVDILTDADLTALYRHHTHSGAVATLLTARRDSSRTLFFDASRHLAGWMDKRTGETAPEGFNPVAGTYTEQAFEGIHVISPTLFRYMDDARWSGSFSIIPFYLSICRQVPIASYPFQGSRWFDIGRPETLAKAEQALRRQAL